MAPWVPRMGRGGGSGTSRQYIPMPKRSGYDRSEIVAANFRSSFSNSLSQQSDTVFQSVCEPQAQADHAYFDGKEVLMDEGTPENAMIMATLLKARQSLMGMVAQCNKELAINKRQRGDVIPEVVVPVPVESRTDAPH